MRGTATGRSSGGGTEATQSGEEARPAKPASAGQSSSAYGSGPLVGPAVGPQLAQLRPQLDRDRLELVDALRERREGLLDARRIEPVVRAGEIVGPRQLAHP